jgi:sulfite oxidase
MVYDISSFLSSHPGGKDKISLACGKNVENFWNLYRQHYDSTTPAQVLNDLGAVGYIPPSELASTPTDSTNPFSNDPQKSPLLVQHTVTPANCETPTAMLTESYYTPNDIFYVRNHHPVPDIKGSDDDITVDFKIGGKTYTLTLDEIKTKIRKTTITATLQCSGNRRSGMNAIKKTSGTPWYQGAISNAVWEGVAVKDVLEYVGGKVGDSEKHVVFKAHDDMEASIFLAKGLSPETILAYSMNGDPLPRDHGYPLRAVIPGYVGVRNVKFVKEVVFSEEEAEGDWQRGINYKLLSPNVTDPKTVDVSKLPPMLEAALFSGITVTEVIDNVVDDKGGDKALVEVKGWAWSGGGRNISRVDLTGDDGSTWSPAALGEGSDQQYLKAWAWTFFEGTVWAKKNKDGKYVVASNADDSSYNVQPKQADWKVRGLNNTSWFNVEVADE